MKHTINLFMENTVEVMLGERNNIYAKCVLQSLQW